MSIQRLRYAQEKQLALAKQSRREVAKLLNEGKEQKAHYRVESLINDDIHVELLEILELYCELLHARVSILNTIHDEIELIEKHTEDGINEALRTIVYASIYAPEIKELLQIKDILGNRFGIDFLKAIVDDKVGVPEKVLKKCSPVLPKKELVELYLQEIAKTYEVSYSGLKSEESDGDIEDYDLSDSNYENDGKPIIAVDNDETGGKKYPITIKKPRKNSDTLSQELKIPKDILNDVKMTHKKEKIDSKNDIDDLRKRFEALRR